MQRGTVEVTGLTARAAYARLADPEATVPGGRLLDDIRAELNQRAQDSGDASLDELGRVARTWASEERLRYLALYERAGGAEVQGVLLRRAALGCAPLARLAGASLQWLSAPGRADDARTLRILALYASDVGVGQPSASRGHAFLALLRAMTLAEHAVPVARLALDRRVADSAFSMPAVLLAMARRPDDFEPEILGADLCLRTVGLPPPLAAVQAALPGAADWSAIDLGAARRAEQPPAVDRCREAVEELLASGDEVAGRVNLGFGWSLEALRRWSGALYAELEAACDPAFEMAELLRQRAREAAIYHHDYRLDGRPLAEWLRECRTDPSGMLRALASSKLVKPGRSETSALVSSLIGERGPMFRVFAPEDVTVIRRWIDGLLVGRANGQPEPASTRQSRVDEPSPSFFPSLTAAWTGEDRAPATLREAYCRLMCRTGSPALRRFALDHARGWLARARFGMERAENQLPPRWSPEGLRPWLAEEHDRHDREFHEGEEAVVPSREALIDSTVQLALLTLIDGAWLQGFTDYALASSETGYFLFETYWDELGNGEAHLNHPLIYRDVLAEMGVSLPGTGSREFAAWPGFRDRSFELPVFWLSIGRFPSTFLPEVLGLNLAMELSGVGGGYRRARIALRAHGFSTRFVDVHNTIDNVAAGHSAWAADAVDSYLSALSLSQGAAALAETWERVRAGYRSLNPPDGFWARRAERRARRRARSQAAHA
jgi:heme oxygenase-like protein